MSADSRDPSGLTPEQRWYSYERYPYLLARFATWALVVLAVAWFVTRIEAVLVPVLIALAIAYLLDPAVDRLEARGWSRTQGVAWVFFGMVVLAVLFVAFLYPPLAKQVGLVLIRLPEIANIVDHEVLPWVEVTFGVAVPDSMGSALELARQQIPSLAKPLAGAAGELWSRVGTLAASLINLVLVPVLTAFFLRDFDRLRLAAFDLVPPDLRPGFARRLTAMDEVVGAWFRGQVEVAGVLSVAYGLGLAVVFGVAGIGPLTGLAIGVLTGWLNVIPYFGPLIGMFLAVSHVLLWWSGMGPLLGVVGVFVGVQQLEAYVVTPRLVGDKVGLPPVVVILSLLLGGQLLGLVGLLLALPLAGVLRVWLPDLIDAWRASELFSGKLRAAQKPDSVSPPGDDSG